MPKGRYAVMREYFPAGLALFMMKGTCSVQADWDFLNEADYLIRVTSTDLSHDRPGPLYKGQPTGFKSTGATSGPVLTRTDRPSGPARRLQPRALGRLPARRTDDAYVRDGRFTPAEGRP